ncbi:hypothetical protein FRX31_005426 [Thalictrum thalictroides]|uniref:Uncharacterized protein n=1 Tax=Thalictrum thalictroides TaxID=46969 RepID=A0A7J6X5N8_THATH|nr:hypothetical protein FRX31_005426 [Thalictrum thalictroides]
MCHGSPPIPDKYLPIEDTAPSTRTVFLCLLISSAFANHRTSDGGIISSDDETPGNHASEVCLPTHLPDPGGIISSDEETPGNHTSICLPTHLLDIGGTPPESDPLFPSDVLMEIMSRLLDKDALTWKSAGGVSADMGSHIYEMNKAKIRRFPRAAKVDFDGWEVVEVLIRKWCYKQLALGVIFCGKKSQMPQVGMIDIHTGSHKVVDFPIDSYKHTYLIEMEGKLHFCQDTDEEIVIWSYQDQFKDYFFWFKEFRIPLANALSAIHEGSFRIAQIVLKKQICIIVKNELLLINLKKGLISSYIVHWANARTIWNLDNCCLDRIFAKQWHIARNENDRDENEEIPLSGLERFRSDQF